MSPNGRWLDAGSFSVEGAADISKEVHTWRYDLLRGGHTDEGYDYNYAWLTDKIVAAPVGTDDEDVKTSIGMEGDRAPIIGLFRPLDLKPFRVYRDQMFARDSYLDVRLSQNQRQLWVYSRRWIRSFDIRSGRLLSRTKWPFSRDSERAISPDGRWTVGCDLDAKHSVVHLYGQKGQLRRDFPGRDNSLGSMWLSPTIFSLARNLSWRGRPDQSRTFTEFYDARTLKRLWVLADRVVYRPLYDVPTVSDIFQNSWNSYNLIPNGDSVIVCGENIWTWRDLRTGKVTRHVLRPKAWALVQPYGGLFNVQKDFYYWSDSKGRIWRESFRFLPVHA